MFYYRVKAALIEAYRQKERKKNQLSDSLQEQIQYKRDHGQKHDELNFSHSHSNGSNTVIENPHARSESLTFLYQREKARQLYKEQLLIVEEKREHERRLEAVSRENAQKRLDLAKAE